ncbi:MAG: hypothetical protein P8M13_07860, partial [Luminiphilus sp.]|nr:hypothetical protein [Luminiphilus sp.]
NPLETVRRLFFKHLSAFAAIDGYGLVTRGHLSNIHPEIYTTMHQCVETRYHRIQDAAEPDK